MVQSEPGPRVEYRVLSPLEATVDSTPLNLGGIRQQTVLATLLLDANRVVGVDRLVRAVYEEAPPATARAQLQISVSALRRLFGNHGVSDVITTHPQGYMVRAADENLDALHFRGLVGRARKLRDAGQRGEAAATYRQALGLWRGVALEGMYSEVVRSGAGKLTEQRTAAAEECIQLELALGKHSALVGELLGLVDEFPLRERLRGQLMLALYRSGRQTEALQVYRDTRQWMIDELGVEPDPRLKRLEHSILATDPRLDLPGTRKAAAPEAPAAATEAAAPAAPVPEMLPADIADFTGRDDLVAGIRERLLLCSHDQSRLAVPIVSIVGKAGVGKTAMAVHVAHEVAAEFPGGQLFADLHGGAPDMVGPAQILERFLRALGVSGTAIPDGLEERAEMYRALLAERRMLIVLDNVAGESQIKPLLPGKPTSAVIVTSRRHIGSLAGAVRVDVTTFGPAQSAELLGRITGAERVEAEPEATADLAELCGHLPLALRIAGARLAARPHWEVAELVERLEDETRRLDELNYADVGIRASLSLTYDSVSEDARRLFRRLAVVEEGPFSAWTGMALLDLSEAPVRDLIDELSDAQLVDTAGTATGRHSQYQLHNLIRVFARERLADEETVEAREAALARVLGCFLFLMTEARHREYGQDVLIRSHDVPLHPLPDRTVDRILAEPLQWFARERQMLLPSVRQAAMMGLTAHCWGLAVTAVTFLETHVRLDDWRDTHEVALAAARKGGDLLGQAATLQSLGSLAVTKQNFAAAETHFRHSAEIFDGIGDALGSALAARGLGYLARLHGRAEEATAHYEAALKVFRESDGTVAVAYVLHNLAQLRLGSGDEDAAGPLLDEALRLSREGRGRRVEAQVLHRMGQTRLERGEYDEALEAFTEVHKVVRLIGDHTGEAYALHGIGSARFRRGETAEAADALHRALVLAESSDERLVMGRTLVTLGELALAIGEPGRAVAHLTRVLPLFRQMETPAQEAGALVLLHAAHLAAGDPEAAGRALADVRELTATMAPEAAGRVLARLTETADQDAVATAG
ncbi:BTAD domain-containing putative transcriptional regulator [Streptomyces sp. SR27]|uniref:AfsR/SARP family transcriptional regulator n=1 Tax=unclassified Streptomyces TaxID=2593676 RepID=UPI00295A8956|nr:BTAD domain-containing putative transcriptional regulator [Streptomyces sp. SR27]MDV9187071.1 BTAD domain-containing putative transcriptional regulator [Streptomyces sp. SR27]